MEKCGYLQSLLSSFHQWPFAFLSGLSTMQGPRVAAGICDTAEGAAQHQHGQRRANLRRVAVLRRGPGQGGRKT